MPLSGAEAIAQVRSETDTVLLGFSCGKDSIGTWLELRKRFPRIVPYYLYLAPDLEFVEASLTYYERWFGCPIIRLPHPSLYRMWNNRVFQPPQNDAIIGAANLSSLDYQDLQRLLREHHSLGPESLAAIGVRAADSPYRLLSLRKYGPIRRGKGEFYPVWDWNKARLLEEIRSAGVKLPADYRLFGRSFDGLDYRFLAPIQKHFPQDFARILEYHPMADLELFRREQCR